MIKIKFYKLDSFAIGLWIGDMGRRKGVWMYFWPIGIFIGTIEKWEEGE